MDDSATCYQLTDEEILDGQKIAIQEDPLKLVEHRFLRIKTKGAGLVNLKLNSCQRIIIDIIKEKMNEGKPVRAWVLKARQEGVSTLTEAVIYAFTSQQNNVNSLILADEKEHANNLFEMSKLYQEKLTEEHPHLAPKLKRSNEKKLEFDGILSQIIIASAENTESAKSHTFQMVHLCMSENTRVLVNDNRIKQIKNVKKGDKIITHLGHSAKVKGLSVNKTKDICGNNELVSIKISGGHRFPIECTPGHKLFVRDKKCNSPIIKNGYPCGSTKTGSRVNGRGKWTEAKNVNKGDMLGLPLRIVHHKFKDKTYTIANKIIKADFDLGYVFGVYLAEGSIGYNKGKNGALPSSVTLSMGQGEEHILDKVSSITKSYITSYSFKARKNSKAILGVYYGSKFARFIVKELGDKNNKHIPNKYFSYPKEFILGLIKGYLDGDGHIPDKGNIIMVSSIRPQILLQLRDLLLGMRIGYSSLMRRDGGYYYGRNCKEIWTLGIYGHTSAKLRELLGYKTTKRKYRRDWRLGRKHCWVKVDSIEKAESKVVYDVILDHSDHSYRLINGVAVHNSEIAYFRDFEKIMGDLNQTVPDLPGTLVIGETTANGMNMFYDEWIKAIEGTTSWIPIFIPWFVLDEYSMPLENGELYPIGGIKFESELTKVMFSEEEVKIKEENELTDEQINWRRYAIVNKCGGDLNRFDQEYPTCWEDAFKMSGKLFFDKNGLEKQESKVPISTGEIALVDNMYTFRELPTGRIKIYAYPVQGDTYVVAGDTSEAVGNDEAGLLVLNKRTNETVAVVVGQVPPEDIANLGVDLAEFYNKAVLAIENRGYGYAANQTAYRRYGNVYRKVITRKGTIERTQDLGFNTNSVTRPEMLSRMAEEVSINSTKLVDKDLIDECYTFVNKFDKYGNFQKTEAATSKQDGLVICRAIAGQVRYEQPHKPVVSTRRIPSKARNSVPLKRKKNAGIAYRSS